MKVLLEKGVIAPIGDVLNKSGKNCFVSRNGLIIMEDSVREECTIYGLGKNDSLPTCANYDTLQSSGLGLFAFSKKVRSSDLGKTLSLLDGQYVCSWGSDPDGNPQYRDFLDNLL